MEHIYNDPLAETLASYKSAVFLFSLPFDLKLTGVTHNQTGQDYLYIPNWTDWASEAALELAESTQLSGLHLEGPAAVQ